jgi:hypothetical protein
MKKLVLLFTILGTLSMNAQTVEEILSNYFENIGGKEKLRQVKGIKMTAKLNQGGMEIPLEIIQLSNGKGIIE